MSTPTSPHAHTRRDVLKLFGTGAALIGSTTLLTACDDDDPVSDDGDGDFDAVTLDFSDDFGVLNYALALEQLEAAFYATVTANAAFSDTFNDDEQRILRDLQAHEEIHRDFLSAAIAQLGGTAIGSLTPNFDAVDFSNRSSVLGTAQTFEDLGVAAYNGAGSRLSSTDTGRMLLGIAGKIVSVEARHASVISGLLEANSIAGDGVIDGMALDRAFEPDQVLSAAAPFIRNRITTANA